MVYILDYLDSVYLVTFQFHEVTNPTYPAACMVT
jgi:hypothetical protein